MNTEHGISTLRRRSAALVAALLTPAMIFATPMSAGAQEAEPGALTLRSYPLAIHQGTCDTVVAEPSYDLGFLVPRALNVETDAAVVDNAAYTTGTFDPFERRAFYDDVDEAQNELIDENTGLLFDDIDDDGFVDYGLDLDRNQVLDEAEIIERPLLWAYENDLADIEPAAVVDDAELDEDAALDDLRATPHVLMVHGDTVTDTNYLACGEIQGAEDDEGEIAFALRPVSANGLFGVAQMQEGEDGFLGIGGDSGEIEVWAVPSRIGQATS